MSPPREPVPDLLKRFVPTPFKLLASGCAIESNDLSLLDIFDALQIELPSGYKLRLIRDDGTFVPSAAIRLACTETTCLLLSSSAIVIVDRERKAVFAFVSLGTTPENFAQDILPAALRHSHTPALGKF